MKNNPIIAAVIMIIAALKGCTAGGNTDDMSLFTKKYDLHFDSSGFESEKTRYAAGEEVTVRYDIIATDTDYHFYSDDVEFTQDYDGGYVFTFTMPDHDVTLNVESHNSMEYIPDDKAEATLSFDSFDGGGPEFTVRLSDESLVAYQYKTRYASSGHNDSKRHLNMPNGNHKLKEHNCLSVMLGAASTE